ncbi:MAG: hypothetical protein ACAI44_35670 [Candidatus Sericytochromatia bacterium]
MQMVIQQAAEQPVQVFLRGIISADDAQILLSESAELLERSQPKAVWVHLEQIHQLADPVFDVVRRILALFNQAHVTLTLIAHQSELFQRLIAEGIPVQLHTPDPLLHNATVL